MKIDGIAKLLMAGIAAEVAGLFVYAWNTFDALPSRIPIHFNAEGVADSYARKELAMWLGLPAAGALVCGVSIAVAVVMLKTRAESMNLPYKQRFLALPDEERQPIMRGFARAMLCTGLVWAVFFYTLQSTLFRAALGLVPRFNPVPLAFEVGVVLLLMLGGTLLMALRIRERIGPD